MTVEYQPGESVVHQRNPLTKLWVGLCVVLVAFALGNPVGVAGIVALLLAVSVMAGVLRTITRPLVVIATPLGASLLFFHSLFYPHNRTPLVATEFVTVWREGALFATLTFSRLLVLFLTLYLAVVTIHPKRMTAALEQRGLPNEFAYVYMASITLIYELRERAESILDAQRSRGLDTNANIVRRFRSFIALMVPLLVGALVSAQTRAIALEARGFTNDAVRTHLHDVPETTLDRVLRALAIAVILLVAGSFAHDLLSGVVR